MNIDWGTVLLACLSSGGLFAIIEVLMNRVFKKSDDKDETKKTLEELKNISKESALDRSRSLLLILICHYPKDHQAIIKEAERYFITLKGDSWMWGILSEWAKKQDVNIEYLRLAHKRNCSID